jgi:hypothetical protein
LSKEDAELIVAAVNAYQEPVSVPAPFSVGQWVVIVSCPVRANQSVVGKTGKIKNIDRGDSELPIDIDLSDSSFYAGVWAHTSNLRPATPAEIEQAERQHTPPSEEGA